MVEICAMAEKLDSFDLKILAELQANGALGNQEIADRVGLSASPCSRRIQRLQSTGVIRERVVRLEPRAVGLDLAVLIHIRMDRHTPERFAQFEKAVSTYPEVQECYLITGQEADYQLKIAVPNMDEYQRFLLTKITRIEGVIGVHSSFVLRKAVDTTALPLEYARTQSG
jgi:Lrp/AsnC family leucine-responsive transcriptional regulator